VTRSLWRRAAALALLSILGLTGLTGCQTQAGVAAFVGSQRVSEAQVRDVSDDGLKQRAIAQQVGADVSAYRQLILSRLVKHEVIAGAARTLHVSASKGDIDARVTQSIKQVGGTAQLDVALAQAPLKLPPSQLRPFLRDVVLLDKMGQALTEGTTFTDAELKKFYDDHGGARNGGTFEQLKPQVIDAMRTALGQQRVQVYVTRYARGVTVKVNPRYGRFDRTKLFDPGEAPLIVPVPDDLVRDGTKVASAPA
jgi:hypothetical protein